MPATPIALSLSLTAPLAPTSRPETPETQVRPAPRASAGATVQPATVQVRPAWPGPGTIDLASALLELSTTTVVYTDTIVLPDTGADFWAMLSTALSERKTE
ncbi:MAG: hypothetical protein KDE09_14840 [Anaerolineales bacterium]|nr:hypothetical protein [Anaerolineales bacterium]